MPQRHVEDLFSAAYDDELTESQADSFHQHLRGCATCASGYETFRASVDAVRALPQARMPHTVHLPSTLPVAEQRPRWRRLRMPRPRFGYGGATLVAGVAAAAILAIVLVRPTSQSTRSESGGAAGSQFQGALQQPSGCSPRTVAAQASGDAPAGYNHRALGLDASRPGQRLLLATTTGDVAAGSQVVVYAQLTVPPAVAAAPGGAQAPAGSGPSPQGVIPCLSLSNSGAVSPLAVSSAPVAQDNGGASTHAAASAVGTDNGPSPLFVFTVPPNTPPGTVLYIVATVPPGYPNQGDPILTVNLQITVR